LIFTSLVIGTIGALVQRDPEAVVLKWGFSDFGIFAVALHSIGLVIAAAILRRVLRREGISWDRVGFKNKLTAESLLWSLGFAIIAFVMYPLVEYVVNSIGFYMYWGGEKDSPFCTSIRIGCFLCIDISRIDCSFF
jgi:hypothetical protein